MSKIRETIKKDLYFCEDGFLYERDVDGYKKKNTRFFGKQLYVKHKGENLCVPTIILQSIGQERIGKFIHHNDGNTSNNSIENISFKSMRQNCKITGCSLLCVGNGLCRTHYLRKRKGVDINKKTIRDKREYILEGDVIRIPLGLEAKQGYAVDHIDRNKLNNIKNNLRFTTYSGNSLNRERKKDNALLPDQSGT